jgi:hypothetical protein
MIIGLVIVAIISGGAVTILGYNAPLMIASSILTAIGAGLLSTLQPRSGHSMWIGYQVLFGLGVGIGMQQPPIAAQTVLDLDVVFVRMALMIFAQSIGASIFTSVGQNVFTNRLVSGLREQTPGLDPNVVISAGATGFRGIVSPEDLPGILFAYNEAVVDAFYVAVALAGLSLFGPLAIQWKSVRGKKTVQIVA